MDLKKLNESLEKLQRQLSEIVEIKPIVHVTAAENDLRKRIVDVEKESKKADEELAVLWKEKKVIGDKKIPEKNDVKRLTEYDQEIERLEKVKQKCAEIIKTFNQVISNLKGIKE